MDDIQRRRARGEISDYQWRREYEPKFLQLAGVASSIAAYEAALPGDQNAARVMWDADATQEAFERSIDQDRSAQTLRKQWGASFDAKIDAVDALMQQASQHSSAIKQVVEEHPELFTAPDTMNYLLQLAQSQGRRGITVQPEPPPQSSRTRRRR
jgi:hypothetical protein